MTSFMFCFLVICLIRKLQSSQNFKTAKQRLKLCMYSSFCLCWTSKIKNLNLIKGNHFTLLLHS